MKDSLDDYIRKKWSKIVSKLSKPIAPRNSIFSQEAAQLVFILLFFIIISHTSESVQFSQTFLGHISVVFVLFYFTVVYPMVGAIFSMAMILYYHSDLVKAYYYETILYKNTPSTIHESFQIQQTMEQKDHQYIDIPTNQNIESFRNMEASRINSAYPITADVQTIPSKYSPWFRPMFFNEHQIHEGFESQSTDEVERSEHTSNSNYSQYIATYEQPINISVPYSIRQNTISYDTTEEANIEAQRNASFRQEHCSATGNLMHKDTVINPSMAEFIFPELQIQGTENGHACNPCSSSCKIHISKVDQRLDTESILQQRNRPSLKKTSNDWVPSWFDIFLPHPVFQMSGQESSQPFAKPANKTITF